MYRFPLTDIGLKSYERKMINAINNIHLQHMTPADIKKKIEALDEIETVKNLYNKFFLKEYDGIYYDPNMIDEITYAIFLKKTNLEITIPFYTDEDGNKYEFHEDTNMVKRIIKTNGETTRFMYDNNNRILSEVTNDNYYMYMHHNDYTEKYDKNNPSQTRQVIEPSMKNIFYNIDFFIDKENIKPYYVESNSVKKLLQILYKQNMEKEQIFQLLTQQNVLVITIPAFEKEITLEILDNAKIKYKRLSIETNSYKCRKCGQKIYYQIDRSKIRCPHCHFINIISK